MKRRICLTALTLLFAMGTSVSANSEVTDTAGITPDEFLYPVDKLYEEVELAVTTDAVKEADLLLEQADERLAEAEAMTVEEQPELVTETISDYTEVLAEAQDAVSDVVANEEVEDQTKQELGEQLADAAEIDEDLANQLSEDQKVEVKEQQDEAFLVANVVQGLDTDVVKALRSEDLGYGEIAKVIALSEISGKTVEEIVALLNSGETEIGGVMQELNITMTQVKAQALSKKIDYLEQAIETAKAEGNTKATEKYTKKLKQLNAKKDKLATKLNQDSAVEDDNQTEVEKIDTDELAADGAVSTEALPAAAIEEETASPLATSTENTSKPNADVKKTSQKPDQVAEKAKQTAEVAKQTAEAAKVQAKQIEETAKMQAKQTAEAAKTQAKQALETAIDHGKQQQSKENNGK